VTGVRWQHDANAHGAPHGTVRSRLGWFEQLRGAAAPQKEERSMNETFAQGDLLIERVADVEPSGTLLGPDAAGAWVLAEGEFTGHRHAIYDRVTMFRDEALAREIPAGLYVGHVKVEGGSALIHHQEHAPISLAEGTYRVRRQRELEPRDAVLVSD
jgi:hypothetical protein